jgi:hypothetical protein
MYKFSLEEEVDMSIYSKQSITFGSNNLREGCLPPCATFDDFVQTFRLSSLCYVFLQGGGFGIGPDKNEL